MVKNKVIDKNYLSKEQVAAMLKKYQFNQWPFFYPEVMLAPYWNERRTKWKTFVIIGSKNTGKTTNIIRYALKRAIANRFEQIGRFVLVRRSNKERIAYWHATSSDGKWWPNCVCKKDDIFWVDPETKEKFLVAKLESISGSGIGRGIENKGYDTLIFDDFIGLQGERRISGFSKRLEPMISNYFRDNITNGLVILIGNNDRLDAEWLLENNFQIPTAGGCFELRRQDDKPLKTILYVEGINTKQGIISTHLKDFSDTPLAWASASSLDYLYANFCMVVDENVLDLRKWKWTKERKISYQLSVANQYCVIEGGYYQETKKSKFKKMWICYTVNKNQLNTSKPVLALRLVDKHNTTAVLSPFSRTISEWIWDLFNRHLIGFTNPVIKLELLKGANSWVQKKYIITGHD